ncbi:hypothetical protein FRB91_010319 [Serendipita sp. 411]|nr:hypothetical protein FRB91_010319 [Serendipita sp. 411]
MTLVPVSGPLSRLSVRPLIEILADSATYGWSLGDCIQSASRSFAPFSSYSALRRKSSTGSFQPTPLQT